MLFDCGRPVGLQLLLGDIGPSRRQLALPADDNLHPQEEEAESEILRLLEGNRASLHRSLR